MTNQTRQSDEPLDERLINRLLDDVVQAVPAAKERTPDERRALRETARAILTAMRPRNALEAMLAAQVIAAHHGLMDCFALAARPGTSDSQVIRLRSGAVALGRRFDAAMRALQKSHAPPKPPAHEEPMDTRPPAMPAASPPMNGTPAPPAVPIMQTADKPPSTREALAGSVSQLGINALLAPPLPLRAGTGAGAP